MELHIPVFVARAVLPAIIPAAGNAALCAAHPSRRGEGLIPQSELSGLVVNFNSVICSDNTS